MSDTNQQEGRRAGIYRIIVGVALTLISIGQFNDTKELLSATYEDIKTAFTHEVQYEQLESLSIGRTIPFIEATFGPPEVIKTSSFQPDIRFQYYNIEKAIITVFNNNGRVAGFVIIPLSEDFIPTLPYQDFPLARETISKVSSGQEGLYLDASNLIYYAESEDMGKQYLFLQRIVGFIEYGGLELSLNDAIIDPSLILDDILVLNEFLESGEDDELIEGITAFREEYPANFYAFTELEPSLVTESLLTRVEFETYFGGAHD
ncbi:ETEC_3214 domain-containing protein [Alteromonas lipolytica]|uniref:Uncharacterized protein n=1 Tax=Alteromonas lipolytica TaxID=1856405 RepID=A0A1E8FB73_9ALTE|nr:ETEC_3214 domain-containing protein [Alteromonas lipolytica]OFI32858.1 hypothetical protein BFC17_00855 [Alteromonas lipolytica]GGF64714.1 hypothetical protein GCM10011338_16380 [Alteromonas lipolytica]